MNDTILRRVASSARSSHTPVIPSSVALDAASSGAGVEAPAMREHHHRSATKSVVQLHFRDMPFGRQKWHSAPLNEMHRRRRHECLCGVEVRRLPPKPLPTAMRADAAAPVLPFNLGNVLQAQAEAKWRGSFLEVEPSGRHAATAQKAIALF